MRSSTINGLRIQTDYGPISFLAENGGLSGDNKDREIVRVNFIGVGIGTNDPQYSLDVTGSVRFWNELIVTGSFTASLQEGYTWAGGENNIVKLITTASLIPAIPAGTLSSSYTDFDTYTASIDNVLLSINNITGGLANTSSVNSIINKTGSYATTGSNTFVNRQIISGGLDVTGSVIVSGSTYILGDLTVYGSLILKRNYV